MSKVQTLRAFIEQRLTAAAEEIFGVFGRTISEYEEELCRQQKLLDAVFKPQVRLHRAEVQQLLVCKEELPDIKEEQEELWTNQEGEQLRVQHRNELFKQRLLTAAREDLFGHFDRTIWRYEEEIGRQQKKLDVIFQPELKLQRAALPSDVHKVTAGEAEQQEKSSSLDQKDPPEPPHIKEEQEELWTNQEVEQLQDITELTFTPVAVKSEEDEEKPQSSQLHQTQTEEMKTEGDGEDCGGPEPDRNFNLDAHLIPDTDDFLEPETETDDSDDWKGTREPQTSLNSIKNVNSPLNDVRCRSDEKPFSCSVCDIRFTWSFELKGHKCVGESSQLGELWTNQKGEQLQNMTKSTFTPVPVKSQVDDDEEKPQSSQLHQRPTEQMETEDDEEDCGGPEPDRNSDAERHLTPDADDKTEDCSEPSVDQGKKTKEPQSGLNSRKNNEVPVSEVRCNTDKKPFECSVCRRGFSWRGRLKYHMRAHTGEKPFSCSVCNKCFSLNANLKRHMTTHTGEKPFTCSICRKGFSWNTHLERHMRTHTGEKPFSCSVCNKRFSDNADLRSHMRTHTGEKPFSCSVCNKHFSQKSYLKPHMRTHTGEKPYGCSVCNKRFAHNAHLKSHMRTHTGEKPYFCSVCNKRFAHNTHFKSHMRTHTGERPYICLVCNKSLSRRALLKSHMRTHTGGATQDRSLTPTQFLTKDSLGLINSKNTLHELKHHTCVNWTNREGEQLQDITEFTFTPVPMKSEEDEEKPQSSQLHQTQTEEMKIEDNDEDCGGPEPDRNVFFPEPDDSDDSMRNKDDPLNNVRCRKLGELWTNQEGEWLQNMTKSTFTPVRVKSEEDDGEEKPQSSQLHHRPTEKMKTEDDREDCGGPEPDRNSDPERHLTPDTDHKTEDCSEPGVDQLKETKEPKNNEVPVSDVRCKTDKKPFKCSVCGKGFSLRKNLTLHMRIHTGEKPFSCSVCKKCFSLNTHLKRHMRTHTGEKPFRCSVCNRCFSEGLKRHMRTHTGEKPFTCSVCNKRFSRKADVRLHMRTHTGETPFSCPVCRKGFSQNGHLKSHMRTHTGEKPFSCSVCNTGFSRKAILRSHMRTHTGGSARDRNLTPGQFLAKDSLGLISSKNTSVVLHESKHNTCVNWTSQEGDQLQDITEFTFTPVAVKSEEDEEKPQSSQLHQTQTEGMKIEDDGEDCGRPEADRNLNLDAHLTPDTDDFPEDCSAPGVAQLKETKEPQSGLNLQKINEVPVSDVLCKTDEKPFKCSVCCKGLSSRKSFTYHMRTHTGEKPYMCSVCNKCFSGNTTLKRHMRTHTGEKPFYCSVCNRCFSGGLKRHMRTHTGDKPFSCSVCNKGFSRQAHLKSHLRIHTGETPFTCSICRKGFSQNGQLKSHMRTHTGEKPFSCSVCKKCFSRKAHLKSHMRTHTGEKPFN